jgi:hypothetical protein
MDIAQFWDLIEQSRQSADDCETQARLLTRLLTQLAPTEIQEFDRIFEQLHTASYRWDIWGVAYIINGGCSDDGFEYFRSWLIGQGWQAYEAALADPESVGSLVGDEDEYVECEELFYAANRACKQITGSDLPNDNRLRSGNPIGEKWEEEDLPRLFPRTSARFWGEESDS